MVKFLWLTILSTYVCIAGFVKEQIKVMNTYVDNITLSLKVEGRRPLAGGRWNQFSELYKIPETCDINNINSVFQGGVLTIIMPKIKNNAQKDAKAEATHHETSSSQEIAETSAVQEKQREEKNVVEAPSPQKVTTSTEESTQLDSQKTASLVDDITKQIDESGGETACQKADEMGHAVEASPKAASLVDTAAKIHDAIKRVGTDGESAYKIANEEKEKSEAIGKEKPAEVEKLESKEEEEKQKNDQSEEKRKVEVDDLISEKPKDTKHESAFASEGLIEGKQQLLVNMGTAVLVIVGLGAYLSYTITSFGKV